MSDRYEAIESPQLAALPYVARAQVINAINTTLLAEVLLLLGGEVFLPAGFSDRIGAGRHVVGTRFLDDGRYRVWVEEITPELSHPGAGTLWERAKGPRRVGSPPEVWLVTELGGGYATMERVHPETGAKLGGVPAIKVREDYLRRGVGGWRHWSPPPAVIDDVGGRT